MILKIDAGSSALTNVSVTSPSDAPIETYVINITAINMNATAYKGKIQFMYVITLPFLIGRVEDVTGNGVKGAHIILRNVTHLINKTLTNETGFYSLPIPKGSYYLIASKEGFLNESINITIKGNEFCWQPMNEKILADCVPITTELRLNFKDETSIIPKRIDGVSLLKVVYRWYKGEISDKKLMDVIRQWR